MVFFKSRSFLYENCIELIFYRSILYSHLKTQGSWFSWASYSVYEGETWITKQLEQDNVNYVYSQILTVAHGLCFVINVKKPS